MSLFEARAEKVLEFHDKASKDGMLDKMNPDKKAVVVTFVDRHTVWKAPNLAMREYKLKMAPLETTWDRTRELLGAQNGLLEAFGTCAKNLVLVLAETGPLLLGEDESKDLPLLQQRNAAFVKFFGAQFLPPALKKDELHVQVTEHLDARAKRPPMPPRETLTQLQAEQRELQALCDEAFEAYHDHLDGFYGRKGEEAFKKKAAYGYDRRAGQHHAKADVKKADAKTAENKQAKDAAKKPQDGTAPPEQRAETPETPGPVAGGSAATPTTSVTVETAPAGGPAETSTRPQGTTGG